MVLDGVSVETYGAYQPIKNVASVNIEDPKTLRIAPWDKSQIKAIEKAILTADLGLSVATDEAGIRVIFPQLTTETRQKLVKVLKDKYKQRQIDSDGFNISIAPSQANDMAVFRLSSETPYKPIESGMY